MPKANTSWKVLGHEPITPIGDNLWMVIGTLPDMPLKRVLTVARRSDGKLVFHNAIALEEEAMKQVEGFGEPAFLVVPNGYHRLDAPAFKARYPGLRVLCPAGARNKVAEVVGVEGSYDDFPPDDAVKLYHLDGVKQAEGVMEVRSQDGVTLVFNDAIFNLPHMPGFAGFVFRMLGSTGGPRVTRLMRLFVVKDKKALRGHLEQLAETPDLRRIVVSHGAMITEAPAEVLKQVARGL